MDGLHRKIKSSIIQHDALAAADTTPTSTLHSLPPPLTTWNTVVTKVWEKQHDNDCFLQSTRTSTDPLVQLSIGNPMVNDGDAASHHESCQPVDLMQIQ